MQILNYIPTENQLTLDHIVALSVVDLLLEPFETREQAKEFWREYPSTIIVLNRNDDIEYCLAQLSESTRLFIETAAVNPEFIEDLPCNHQLSLTITSDSGNGFYLIKPVDLTIRRIDDKATSRQVE